MAKIEGIPEVNKHVEGAMRAVGLLPLNEPVFHLVSTFISQLGRRGYEIKPVEEAQ